MTWCLHLSLSCRCKSISWILVAHCYEHILSYVFAQEENPSRECTIVRTAAKLTPFYFNKIPETDDSCVPMATQRRLKKFNLKYDGSMTTEAFCPICNGPLNGSDSSEDESDVLYAACCSSCRFQILPQEPSSLDHFGSLLPHHMISQVKHHQKFDSQTYLR